jgi:hypothetical protein
MVRMGGGRGEENRREDKKGEAKRREEMGDASVRECTRL